MNWRDTLQANEHLGMATPEARGGKEKSSPRAFTEHGPSDFWPPDYERINDCCIKLIKKCYFINAGRKNLI